MANQKKEDKKMATCEVCMPPLRGDVAKSLLKSFSASSVKPYAAKEEARAMKALEGAIKKRVK